MAICEKILGLTHPDVATSFDNLPLLYQAQGKYAEAEPLYKRSLGIREQTRGPDHSHVATSLENYTALLRESARAVDADKMKACAKTIRSKHAK